MELVVDASSEENVPETCRVSVRALDTFLNILTKLFVQILARSGACTCLFRVEVPSWDSQD
jgi:hypothetical protein